ncbi:MAG: ComEC/Rec2 family competence protein, partial [Flavobacteriales bacterium]|nr:ComEC/Rec2 family competence protein [Flavobacteriales bacterium]
GATTPFTLYHFGVFPIYFLPANLIAVPLGTVLMYSILVMLIPDPSGYIHALVGYTAEHIGLLLLTMANIFAHLPFAQIQITEWGIVNSVLVGIGFLVALTSTKNSPLRFASACFIVIIGLTFKRHYQQESLVFFSDKKRSIGIETTDFAVVIGQTKKLPFELQGWATRQQATYFAIVSDTLLISPELVVARKGNQQFSNFACVTNQITETKKYPIAVCEWDTSIFPGIRITSECSQDVWHPSNGAYTLSPN